jgi:FlaA1/EpsC-like NDP-sugar epimerase
MGRRLKSWLRSREPQLVRFTPIGQVVLDVAAWAVGVSVAVYLRLDFNPLPTEKAGLLKFIPIAAVTQIVVGMVIGLYRRRWRYGSFDEVAALVATALISSALLYVLDRNIADPYLVPLSAVAVGGFTGLVMMAAVRYAWRLALEWKKRPDPRLADRRVLVYGAGDPGIGVISSMMRSSGSAYLPVAILDDNPIKRRLSVMGVSVEGGAADLVRVAERHAATTLLISDPMIGPDQVAALSSAATEAGIEVKVLPPVSELVGGAPGVGDIRDLSDADLLGRHQIETDVESIAGYLTGKVVLVTGAGGSIGSELCRQISRYGPASLLMLDRDESALHAVQMSIEGRALLDTPDLVLADIRDAENLRLLFEERRPDVVFHAAALKHLPLLEMYPEEAIKSNVIGTLNVLEAARAAGVSRFVNISTDKAANPTSALGYSKRIAERLTAEIATRTAGTYLSVRFGNVLGSRGSVLTSFRAQIEAGGPVTVTDPEVSRFFMTVQEAVQLVIQAGAIGRDGEVLILDMGEPVRIADVAERLINQAKRSVKIVFTGLRPGEKLHEELFGEGEVDSRPKHPLISHTPVPPISMVHCDNLESTGSLQWMAACCRAAI